MTPLEMYLKICPNAQLNFFQMEMIEAEVTDIDAWKETLRFWFGNGYREKSVFRMLEYYKEVIDKRSQGRWQDVGRDTSESDPNYVWTPPPPCQCGKEICFTDHNAH